MLTAVFMMSWFAVGVSHSLKVAWELAFVFGAISLLFIIGNPVAGVIAKRRGKSYSCAPFLGGIFGSLCLCVCPIHGAYYFAWIPLILDITFPSFLYAVFVLGAFRSK
ncbi:MAG: hypothetical protein LLG00_01155 [Planctomycetaceae bacterium]|nr:hypothetical protein [Planctomycetaceae bacterium]